MATVDRGSHWEGVYASKPATEVSWFEPTPATSLRLVLTDGVPSTVIDVGAGASLLADALLDAGVDHVTLVDLSLSALALVSARLDERANDVTTVAADVLTFELGESFDVWHDRAVFHFLTDAADRAAYVGKAAAHVRPGGLLVVGTFAEDGPEQCSGLPTQRYDAASLAAEFGEVFALVNSERIEHHTPWDTVQPFTWVVLRRRHP